jgi:predicted permease
MTDVLSLSLPFFGLVFAGVFCGRLMKYPEEGLRWMNFFIIYVALPALFFKLIATTPFEQLSNWPFVLTIAACTYAAFALSFAVGILASAGNMREAAIQGVLGAYSNVGYMGPGLTLAALGAGASVPTALIFVVDCTLFFTLVPFLMAIGGDQRSNLPRIIGQALWKVVTHPFNIATIVAIIASYLRFQPPAALDQLLTLLKNAAAPCALFALGVTVALRPLKRVPRELPVLLGIKLIVHPALVWVVLSASGDFDRIWTFTAMLMASLPPAGNVFVMARQYETYVERASSGVLIGTIVSVVTVTGLLYLIGAGLIPHDLFPGTR